MLWRALIIAVVVLVLFSIYVRLAPSDVARWHVDPEEAQDPGNGGVLIRVDQSPVWAQSAPEVMTQFAALIPDRTMVLSGTAADAHMTFVTRSRMFGFPDYTSVRAVAGEDGTRLIIYGRLRFGQADLGVNHARVEAWLQRLTTVLPPR